MSRTRKPRRGRPPIAPQEVKRAIFSIRLSPAERVRVEQAAALAHRYASDWAREGLLRAADSVSDAPDHTKEKIP